MADNVTLDSGSGGDTIAADDISGTKHQRVKVQYGADGFATDVSDANPLPIDDAGGSLTIDNADITSIKTAVEIIDNAISGSEMQVDVVGPLPAGSNTIGVVDLGTTDNTVLDNISTALDAIKVAIELIDTVGSGTEATAQRVTLATDSTGVLSVDDNGASLTIDNADITSIKTAVEIIDNAISGSEMQVDVVAALPAGSNLIGAVDLGPTDNAVLDSINTKLDAIKTAVELMDTVGGGTEATAQRVTIANDSTGVLSVDDGGGSLTIDNANLTTIAGAVSGSEMQVDIVSGATSGEQLVDDAAFTPATNKVTMAGFEFDDSAPDSVDEGDGGAARMSANRNVYMTTRDAAGNERGVNVTAGNALTVDGSASTQPISGTVTANLSTTDNTVLDNIDTSTAAMKTALELIDTVGGGTEATAQRVTIANDSTGVVSIDDNGGSLTIDNADIASIKTAVEILDNAISGNEMQVDVITQPVRAATTDNIGAAQMTNVIHDGTTALTPKFKIIDGASSGNNTLLAAVSGKKIRVLSLFLVAAGAVNVRFEDGADGTALTGQMNLVANTGFSLPFNPVGWFEGGSNTLLNMELSAGVSCDGCFTYVEV